MQKLTAEKCREQFEYWIKLFGQPNLTRANGGANYADGDVNMAWLAWKASRERLEIALPILEQQERGDGWIEWGGGECPVADHVKVEYQLRGGAKGSEPARRLDWQHEGKRHDIIAYRIIPEQPTNQNGEQ